MARPQLEDGHTRIANEILEHLMKMHLSANQWQVLLCIIRKTYGYHKKVDHIANFQIGEATDLGKTVVSRILHTLEDMQLITRKGKFIGFQKDWERWQKLAVQSTSGELAERSTLSSKLAEQSTPEKLAVQSTELAILSTELAEQSTKVSSAEPENSALKIKDTLTKDTIQKKEYGEFNNVLLSDEEYQKLIERFGEEGADERIEVLSTGIASKGYKYKSHYATVLAWDKRDKRGGQDGADQRRTGSRQLPKVYRTPEQIRPRSDED